MAGKYWKSLPIIDWVVTNICLSDTQAGLDDIYDIIAKFFALVDEIHINGTYGVSVFVIVHVSDVLRLQLVAVSDPSSSGSSA